MQTRITVAIIYLFGLFGCSEGPKFVCAASSNVQAKSTKVSQTPLSSEVSDFRGYKTLKLLVINGDSEKRHLKNVERAVKTLVSLGMSEKDAFVVGQSSLKVTNTFENSIAGVKKAFSAVKKGLTSDTLVVLYTTGHGEQKKGKACLVLKKECLKVDAFARMVKTTLGEQPVIYLGDQCYSGAFPHQLMKEKVNGRAMTPVWKGKLAICHLFTPHFFRALREKIDLNKDKKTSFAEAFYYTLSQYKEGNQNLDISGTFRQSIPEMTLQNVHSLIKGTRPLLMEIGPTWCGPCHWVKKEMELLPLLLMDKIKLASITSDKNKAKKKLMKILGLKRIDSTPLLLLIKDGKILHKTVGARSCDKLARLIRKFVPMPVSKKMLYRYLEKHPKLQDIPRQHLKDYFRRGILRVSTMKYLWRFGITEIDFSHFIPRKYLLPLLTSYISARVANRYARWFSGYEVRHLVKKSIPFWKANAYGRRFDAKTIITLIKAKVPPSTAKRFHHRFSGSDIRELAKAKVGPKVANKFNKSFKGEGIAFIAKKGQLRLWMHFNRFAKRFKSPRAVGWFLEKGISFARVNRYDKRFDAFSVVLFIQQDISPEKALLYHKRFDWIDFAYLVPNKHEEKKQKLISAQVANRFARRFSGAVITFLIRANISPTLASRYDKRFSNYPDLYDLTQGNKGKPVVMPFVANTYLEPKGKKRFSGEDIAKLVQAKISAPLVRSYDERFQVKDIIHLVKKDIPPNIAAEYLGKDKKRRFRGWEISMFIKKTLPPETVLAFKRLKGLTIIELLSAGFSVAQGNAYSNRFTDKAVMKLIGAKISSEKACAFDDRFKASDIIQLVGVGLEPSQANAYSKRFSNNYVSAFVANKLTPEVVNKLAVLKNKYSLLDLMYYLLSGMTLAQIESYPGFTSAPTRTYFYKLGISGRLSHSHPVWSRRFDEFVRGIHYSLLIIWLVLSLLMACLVVAGVMVCNRWVIGLSKKNSLSYSCSSFGRQAYSVNGQAIELVEEKNHILLNIKKFSFFDDGKERLLEVMKQPSFCYGLFGLFSSDWDWSMRILVDGIVVADDSSSPDLKTIRVLKTMCFWFFLFLGFVLLVCMWLDAGMYIVA